MLYEILEHDHIHWHPQLISNYTNLDLVTESEMTTLALFQNPKGFSRKFTTGTASHRRCYSSGSVPFRTCMCSNVETILSWTCHVSWIWISNISVLLFCFVRFLSSTIFWNMKEVYKTKLIAAPSSRSTLISNKEKIMIVYFIIKRVLWAKSYIFCEKFVFGEKYIYFFTIF